MADSPRSELAEALIAFARAVKKTLGYTPTDARLDVVERPDKPIRLTFPRDLDDGERKPRKP